MIHRLDMSAHVGRQQREREIRTTMAPIRSTITPAQKLESLAVIAPFATVAAWYVFNATAAVFVALVFAAACLTQWVAMRRGS